MIVEPISLTSRLDDIVKEIDNPQIYYYGDSPEIEIGYNVVLGKYFLKRGDRRSGYYDLRNGEVHVTPDGIYLLERIDRVIPDPDHVSFAVYVPVKLSSDLEEICRNYNVRNLIKMRVVGSKIQGIKNLGAKDFQVELDSDLNIIRVESLD